ncbi:MAG: hypothetical protein IK025_09475 [Bacteroidales bacterium]|nr:hypothetical protein [Bacteroidales bacterium]
MKNKLYIVVNCLFAIALVWFAGCTKDVEADFDCPASVVAGETFFVSNYSFNAYYYIWEFGDKSYVSSTANYDDALAAVNGASFDSALDGFWGGSKEDYDYYIGQDPDPVYFKYAGEKKIILHAYSKNGKKSCHKTKYIKVINPSSYTITSLELQKINMSSWDTGILSGEDPDIYFNIVDMNGSVLYTSTTKSNVGEHSLPISWNFSQTLDYSSNYYIKFYDKDDGVDSDDNMANCVFESSYLTPGSDSFTWTAAYESIKFTVGLSW